MDIPDELIEAKRVVELGLLGLPGFAGISLGMLEVDGEFFDELAVRIYVEDAANLPEGLPEEIAGVGVCIIERQFDPCGFPDQSRYDDLMGGVRIAQPLRGAGTLGALVEDVTTGETLGLSCQHVVGDPGQDFVYQPTEPPMLPPISEADRIGEVVRSDAPHTPPLPFSPILVGMVDAAVVSLGAATGPASAPPRTLSRAIADQGPGQPPLVTAVTGRSVVTPGVTRLRKRGFVTGVTHGLALARYFTLPWSPGGPNAWLMEQTEILGDGPFVTDGDSGSLVLEEDSSTAVGLLWGKQRAGLVAPDRIGVMCEIQNVESALGISVVFA